MRAPTAGPLPAAIVLAALVLAGLFPAASAGAAPCGGIDDPCRVADGRYFAAAPPGWDGRTPLPTVIFFHGWAATGAAMMRDRSLVDAFAREGQLAVFPDGRDRTWAHQGSPSRARDDIAFFDSVLADIRRRWPVDDRRLWVSGISQGGSMAWDVACRRADRIAAVVALSGAFWEPLPAHCPGGPVNLRHIHGTADTVVPMAGRPIGASFHQGDVGAGMALWRRIDGCPEAPDGTIESGGLHCADWRSCTSRRALQLCLHDGGHVRPAGWIAAAVGWIDRLAAAD